uniref:Uncharacterized protein n=1 Tax=Oryza glaberrima TaxID=4538 RepID=I1NR36_ORYGL
WVAGGVVCGGGGGENGGAEDGAREERRRDGGGEVARSRLAEDGGQRWRAQPLDAPLRRRLSRSLSLSPL